MIEVKTRGNGSSLRILELPDLLQLDRHEWTLGDLFGVFRRRRRYLYWCLSVMLVAVTMYCLLATPRYQATGEIEIQKESSGSFGLENNVVGSSSGTESDALDYSMTLETEASILESSTLALQVVKDLNLESTYDYFPVHREALHLPAWIFFWKKPVEPLSVKIDDAPNRRYVVLKIFASHLKVKPMTGTRLIEISYSDPDPERASQIVNHLILSLTDYTFQSRYRTASQTFTWLAGQLAGLKQQTESLQEKANRLQRNTGLYGEDGTHNIVLDRLEHLNQTLTAAESNRLLKEAIYQVAQSGDAELISGLAGNTNNAMNNSLALLQSLRTQESSTQAELAQADARYGTAHPRIGELHAELDGVEHSIHEEITRIGERSRTDYEIAQKAEDAARASFEQQKVLANDTNNKAVAFELARQEADSSRVVYQGLLEKLKESGVLEGLRSTNLTVVSPGLVPPTNHPKSPNIPLYYAVAIVGGLFLGCTGAVAKEFSDHTVRSPGMLEKLIEAPLLGIVPRIKNASSFHKLLHRGSATPHIHTAGSLQHSAEAALLTEAVRSLRTSILLLKETRQSQVILITSSVPEEGKSRLAVDLASVLAQIGSRVLLVDADLRCPSIHSMMGIPRTAGLGSALTGQSSPIVVRHSKWKNLSLLCGDEVIPSPAERLASQRMSELLDRWRDAYDFILLDSPPVLPVTDAIVLSQLSDITLLVARYGFTAEQAIQRSHLMLHEQLPKHAALRVVLNGMPMDSEDYYNYYGYKSKPYQYAAGRSGKGHSANA
jgi:polysaccharide biosynthesis transport protein